jgi:hypothetical protein
MIQRLQTLYFAISMILLAILLTGMDIFRFVTEKTTYAYSAFGIESRVTGSPNSKTETISSAPYYIGIIVLILFIFFRFDELQKIEFSSEASKSSFLFVFIIDNWCCFGFSTLWQLRYI